MIISDSKKFIFFHVPKTGGSSMVVKLAKYSNNNKLLNGEYEMYIDDIIKERYVGRKTLQKLIDAVPKGFLPDYYKKNPDKIGWMNLPHFRHSPHPNLSGNPKGDFNSFLKSNQKKYKNYCKFAVVRNSWDFVFSLFKNKIVMDRVAQIWDEDMDWDAMIDERITKASFLDFIYNLESKYNNIYNNFFYSESLKMPLNQQVYFCDENYNSYADFILRFGNLKAQLKKITKEININFENLSEENVSQKHFKHYTDFYDDKAKSKIEKLFKLDIERFNFEYGQ